MNGKETVTEETVKKSFAENVEALRAAGDKFIAVTNPAYLEYADTLVSIVTNTDDVTVAFIALAEIERVNRAVSETMKEALKKFGV